MSKRNQFRNVPEYPTHDAAPEVRNELRKNGRVVKLMGDKGFGFIADVSGTQYFFHRSGVRENGWSDLTVQQLVSFIVRESPKGPRAEDVILLEEGNAL